MGLKQRVEAAALKVIAEAGHYQGTLLLSQQSQETTVGLSTVVAVATVLEGARVGSQGQYIGQVRCRLDVLILTDADKQGVEDTDPEVAHGLHVEEIRDSLQLANLAELLTAADDEITIQAALPRQASNQAPERKFFDGFAWELVCYESKV